MAQREQVFDTLRLSSKELTRIVEELESRANNVQAGVHRSSRRWAMQSQKVIVTLVGPGNQRMHFLVAPRNLSQGGMAFLSGNYLHVGSQCFMTLRSVEGKGVVIPAKVRRCQHLENRLHDVGVEFDQRIDPRNFMINTGGNHLFNTERVQVQDLCGTVLVVNSEPFEQRLIGHYFANSKIEVMFAGNAEQGAFMASMRPDMLFVDTTLPDRSGFDLVRDLRSAGNTCPIVMLSAESSEDMRKRAFDCGASEILFKPVPPELIHQAAAEYLVSAAEGRRVESDGVAEIVMVEGIGKQERTEYAQELHLVADSILAACDAGDAELIRSKLQMVKSSASGFGYPGVAQMASDTLLCLTRIDNLELARTEIDRFVRNLKTVNAA